MHSIKPDKKSNIKQARHKPSHTHLTFQACPSPHSSLSTYNYNLTPQSNFPLITSAPSEYDPPYSYTATCFHEPS